MVALHGTVSALSLMDGQQNLFGAMQSKMLGTGMAGIVEDLAGSVTGACMVALYDDEFVQNFACYIGTNLVIGTFESVGFEDGEDVTVYVTEIEDGAFFAHAALRTKDGMLWMPHSINRGRYAMAVWITKMLGSICVLGLIFVMSACSFFSRLDDVLKLVTYLVPALLLVGGFIGTMTFWSSKGEAMYAERILKAIGFKSPWRVNLAPFSEAHLKSGSSYQVYDIQRAMSFYGRR